MIALDDRKLVGWLASDEKRRWQRTAKLDQEQESGTRVPDSGTAAGQLCLRLSRELPEVPQKLSQAFVFVPKRRRRHWVNSGHI